MTSKNIYPPTGVHKCGFCFAIMQEDIPHACDNQPPSPKVVKEPIDLQYQTRHQFDSVSPPNDIDILVYADGMQLARVYRWRYGELGYYDGKIFRITILNNIAQYKWSLIPESPQKDDSEHSPWDGYFLKCRDEYGGDARSFGLVTHDEKLVFCSDSEILKRHDMYAALCKHIQRVLSKGGYDL